MNPEFNGSESLDTVQVSKVKTTKNKNDSQFDPDSPYNELFFHNFEQVLIEYIKTINNNK